MLETALGAELSEHLGYPPGQAPPGGAGNVRNGSTPSGSGPTSAGPGAHSARPGRDVRAAAGAQAADRLAGLDERVLDLYAGGMSVRDIAGHLQGLYGVDVGRDTTSRVTDAVLRMCTAYLSRC